MKRFITILLILVVTISNATNYYLSPTGSDSNPGTLAAPYWTLNKAWTVIAPGDTVFMRGGSYNYTAMQFLTGKSGNASNNIVIRPYASEKPIINRALGSITNIGVYIEGNYIYMKGLEITGFEQVASTYFTYGLQAKHINNCTFELLDHHDNGFGIAISGNSGGNTVLNCDSYCNSDPLTNFDGNVPYGGSDGITIRTYNRSDTNWIIGCRMYWNSDDGTDFWGNDGVIIIRDSWAFWNGYVPRTFTTGGNGNGFKIGQPLTNSGKVRYLYNCLAFSNRLASFDQAAGTISYIAEIANCTAYDCLQGFVFATVLTPPPANVFMNNLKYDCGGGNGMTAQAIRFNNTWDLSITITDDDFVSLNSSVMTHKRQSNGELPINDFLRLKPDSELIDAGFDFGATYIGRAPDIGAFEYYINSNKAVFDHNNSMYHGGTQIIY